MTQARDAAPAGGDTPAPHELIVPAALDGQRLDRVVATLHPELSRTEARRLIDLERVTVDGAPRRAAARMVAGERLVVRPLPKEPQRGIEPEALPLDIVYEDEHLVVVNKAPGVVVHPGAGRRRGTLVAALLDRYADLPGDAERPGVVHRLDRNTSGLLVVARTAAAMKSLSAQIAAREVTREYRALVWGTPSPRSGVIDVRITRSRRDRRRMAPSTHRGRPAATEYRVLESWDVASLLEVRLRTGRTHQIRVHMAHLGHPVVGDPEYGGRQKGLLSLPVPARPRGKALLATIDRQALHAGRLRFRHPLGGELLDLIAPPPPEFEACCRLLAGEG